MLVGVSTVESTGHQTDAEKSGAKRIWRDDFGAGEENRPNELPRSGTLQKPQSSIHLFVEKCGLQGFQRSTFNQKLTAECGPGKEEQVSSN
jgi:hypothetical protein